MTPSNKRPRRMLFLLGAAVVAGAAGARPSLGLPAVDQAAADATVEDVDGKKLSMSSLSGKVVVVVYEDKDSSAVNKAFKDDMGRLMDEASLKQSVVVVPIADVSAYNSWPAKGFVKDAIREESKKAGTTIWCDWDASFRKAFELTKGTSNVVLIGRDGTVRFAAEGALSAAQRASAEKTLRAEVAKETKS